MNKTFYIKGETKEGHKFEHKVEFTGSVDENNYGTGLYIEVKVNGNWHAYLDARYDRRPFEDICKSYIKNYWGTNLKEMKEGA